MGAIYLVDQKYYDIPLSDSLLFILPTMAFGLALIAQFVGDIMNVNRILNNGFVTFVKRLIFFAACVFATYCAYILIFIVTPGGEPFELEFVERGLTLAAPFIPLSAMLLVVLGYDFYLLSEHKLLFLLVGPLSIALGVGLGIGASALMNNIPDFDWQMGYPFLLFLVALISISICIKWRRWPFDEYVSGSFEYSYQGGGGGYSPSTSGGGSDSGWDVCRDCIYFTYEYDKYGCAQYRCRKNTSMSIHEYKPSCRDFKMK
jgi:hypothetical protein